MGQKNAKRTVSITNPDGRIRLRWRYQHQRYSLNLFHFTMSLLFQAKKIAPDRTRDIHNDNISEKVQARSSTRYSSIKIKSLVEHFEYYSRH